MCAEICKPARKIIEMLETWNFNTYSLSVAVKLTSHIVGSDIKVAVESEIVVDVLMTYFVA